MIILLIAVALGIVALSTGNVDAQIAFGVIGGIVGAITLLVQGSFYYNFVERQEKITEYERLKEIYKKQAEAILGEIKQYLTVNYPEHEAKIFQAISDAAKNSTAFMIHYPELKADETILAMAESYKKYWGSVYGADKNMEELRRKNRVAARVIKLYVIPLLPASRDGDR